MSNDQIIPVSPKQQERWIYIFIHEWILHKTISWSTNFTASIRKVDLQFYSGSRILEQTFLFKIFIILMRYDIIGLLTSFEYKNELSRIW